MNESAIAVTGLMAAAIFSARIHYHKNTLRRSIIVANEALASNKTHREYRTVNDKTKNDKIMGRGIFGSKSQLLKILSTVICKTRMV